MLAKAQAAAGEKGVAAPPIERVDNGPPLVSGADICVEFGGKTVLDHVNIDIRAREIVTLIGPNGAGKTTLSHALLGLVPLKSGHVKRKAGLRIGYVPQRFPVKPVIPLSVRRFMMLNTPVSEATALECLAETGAAPLLDAQMADLSGGEFQRVLLARALARDPQFLVLDEPAQSLDFLGAANLYDLIGVIRDRRECGILLISHDLHVVLGASDRVICLNRHICCEGVPRAVAGHPEYVRLFGPEASASLGLYKHSHDHTHSLSGEVSGGHDCHAR
jgi:zinc transport system ATP-binding protein